MNSKSTAILIVSLLGALGGWAVTLNTWGAAATPVAVGGLLLVLSSNLAAAFGVKTGGNQ